MSRRIVHRRHVIGDMHEPADELAQGRLDIDIHWLDDGNASLTITDRDDGLVTFEVDRVELLRALGGVRG